MKIIEPKPLAIDYMKEYGHVLGDGIIHYESDYTRRFSMEKPANR